MKTTANNTILPRSEIIATIRRMLSADQLEDLEYRISAHDETMQQEIEDYGSTDEKRFDLLDVFLDWLSLAEDVSSYKDADAADRRAARADLKTCNAVLLAIGFYHPITREAAREACRNGVGVRMSHFTTIDGQLYDTDYAYYEIRDIPE